MIPARGGFERSAAAAHGSARRVDRAARNQLGRPALDELSQGVHGRSIPNPYFAAMGDASENRGHRSRSNRAMRSRSSESAGRSLIATDGGVVSCPNTCTMPPSSIGARIRRRRAVPDESQMP